MTRIDMSKTVSGKALEHKKPPAASAVGGWDSTVLRPERVFC